MSYIRFAASVNYGVGVGVAEDVVAGGQGELLGSSFLCASGDLHVTTTIPFAVGAGVHVVVAVTLMIHVPDPHGNFISGPDCNLI